MRHAIEQYGWPPLSLMPGADKPLAAEDLTSPDHANTLWHLVKGLGAAIHKGTQQPDGKSSLLHTMKNMLLASVPFLVVALYREREEGDVQKENKRVRALARERESERERESARARER